MFYSYCKKKKKIPIKSGNNKDDSSRRQPTSPVELVALENPSDHLIGCDNVKPASERRDGDVEAGPAPVLAVTDCQQLLLCNFTDDLESP